MTGPLTAEELAGIDAYWRAANYLAVGQIYLLDNPLLSRPLTAEDVKPRLLGHWGTTPGLNLVYAHLNRVIRERDLDMMLVTGPGHGGPAIVANTWLEGTYSDRYPAVSRDGDGMRRLFKQFSFPGGIPSHVAPEVPGSIHEGGELGYSLSHAFGAAFDNPDLIVACVVGDGEAETGPLATAWHSNKFLNPVTDGVVLPILHLNGYKIANPTVLARIPREELDALLSGYGWRPRFVEGDDPALVHQAMAATLDDVLDEIARMQRECRAANVCSAPRWPMIVLVTPKDCQGCHAREGTEFLASRHADAASFIGSLDNTLGEIIGGGPAANSGCKQCHGSNVAVIKDRPGELDPATWPNTGIGRLNLDGSKGSCTACHSRHAFSIAQARAPEVCAETAAGAAACLPRDGRFRREFRPGRGGGRPASGEIPEQRLHLLHW